MACPRVGLALRSMLLLGLVALTQSNMFAKHWLQAVRQTMFEQEVEDCNAVHKIDNHLARRLIVVPLTDAFNPHTSNAMYGKVQFGDKCSLPASIGRLIFDGNDGKPYEVPWIFEIKPVNSRRKKNFAVRDSSPPETAVNETEAAAAGEQQDPTPPRKVLDKAYISPLDFRSPENYIFLPRWLMATLGLEVGDLVDISFVRIKLAGLVVFQPLTLAWDKLIGAGPEAEAEAAAAGVEAGVEKAAPPPPPKGADPKAILEHEVNKYSALTAGSVIEIEHGGVVYPLLVKETRAENGVRMLGVRVQDSDVKVDIDRRVLDALIKRREELGEGEEEEEGEIDTVVPPPPTPTPSAQRVSRGLQEEEDGDEEEEEEDAEE